jgi:hypothetical protein
MRFEANDQRLTTNDGSSPEEELPEFTDHAAQSKQRLGHPQPAG